jgi:hypothetical protein
MTNPKHYDILGRLNLQSIGDYFGEKNLSQKCGDLGCIENSLHHIAVSIVVLDGFRSLAGNFVPVKLCTGTWKIIGWHILVLSNSSPPNPKTF